jgi:hypothetical protein
MAQQRNGRSDQQPAGLMPGDRSWGKAWPGEQTSSRFCGSSSLLVTRVGDWRIGIPPVELTAPGYRLPTAAWPRHCRSSWRRKRPPSSEFLRRVFTHSWIVTSRTGAPLGSGLLAWIVLTWGQQGAARMAGGMLVLEVVAGRGQNRRVRVRMRLATVQAAQAAHHPRGPFPHCGVALRAVPGKEQDQPVCVHTSSLWAAVRWTLLAAHEGSRQVLQLSLVASTPSPSIHPSS